MFVAINLRRLQFESIAVGFNTNFHICLQNQTVDKLHCSPSHILAIDHTYVYTNSDQILVNSLYQTHLVYFILFSDVLPFPPIPKQLLLWRHYVLLLSKVPQPVLPLPKWWGKYYRFYHTVDLLHCLTSRWAAWRMRTAPRATLVFLRELRSPFAGAQKCRATS